MKNSKKPIDKKDYKNTTSTITNTVKGIVKFEDNIAYLIPSEKNFRNNFIIPKEFRAKAKHNDFVLADIKNPNSRKRIKIVKVIKNYGKFNITKNASTIAIDKFEIPDTFPEDVIMELNQTNNFSQEKRFDLTKLPLVTIDGEDARDFDDAIYAVPDISKHNIGGYKIIIAIADVAFYVREGTALDAEAYKRGNSVYFPDMVIPMLPEKLSNDLCSLRPHQIRPTISAHITIDKLGNILDYTFNRSIIKSAHRLTYNQVQKYIDNNYKDCDKELSGAIKNLNAAYIALDKNRQLRKTLDLDIDEIKIYLDKFGNIGSISPKERLTAHKIVEEFMITANIAAAKQLQHTKQPIMYRIHDLPSEEKLNDIKPLLASFGLKLPQGGSVKPEHLNKVISLCQESKFSQGIKELVLRLQCQAKYSPRNIGHFGLSLKDYAHFTSPIRRYSDLLVHRALISGLELPDDGGFINDISVKFEDIAEHICITERRAVSAERDVVARFVSSYLKNDIDKQFEGYVAGLSDAGIFVRLSNIGADGLIPMTTLPDDDYIYENARMTLKGKYSDHKFTMGDSISVVLKEASEISGGLIFKYFDSEEGLDYYEKGRGRNYARKPKKKNDKHRKKSKYKKK